MGKRDSVQVNTSVPGSKLRAAGKSPGGFMDSGPGYRGCSSRVVAELRRRRRETNGVKPRFETAPSETGAGWFHRGVRNGGGTAAEGVSFKFFSELLDEGLIRAAVMTEGADVLADGDRGAHLQVLGEPTVARVAASAKIHVR